MRGRNLDENCVKLLILPLMGAYWYINNVHVLHSVPLSVYLLQSNLNNISFIKKKKHEILMVYSILFCLLLLHRSAIHSCKIPIYRQDVDWLKIFKVLIELGIRCSYSSLHTISSTLLDASAVWFTPQSFEKN